MSISSEPLYLTPPSGGTSDLASSDSAAWTSMRLRLTEDSANHEFESAPRVDVTLSIPIKLVKHMQVRVSGCWRSIQVHHGLIALTPPQHTWRFRYNSGQDCNSATYLRLYLPASTVAVAAEQLLPRAAESNYLSPALLEDPSTTYFATVMLQSLKDGVSNFYAEASAHRIAAHLTSKRDQIEGWLEKINKGRVTDLRLLRVLEYIEQHLEVDLSLEVLARAAGMSPFQFATLFQRQVGVSANKHVHSLRMQNAARMLTETSRSSAEIALLCGFKTPSHFGVAFHKRFHQSPLAFRAERRWDKLSLGNDRLDISQSSAPNPFQPSTRRSNRQLTSAPD